MDAMASTQPDMIGDMVASEFLLRCLQVGYDMVTLNADFDVNGVYVGRTDLLCGFARREPLVTKPRCLTSMKTPMLAELAKEVSVKRSYPGNNWRTKHKIIEANPQTIIHYLSFHNRRAVNRSVYLTIDKMKDASDHEWVSIYCKAWSDLSHCNLEDDRMLYKTIIESQYERGLTVPDFYQILKYFVIDNKNEEAVRFTRGWHIFYKEKLHWIPDLSRFFTPARPFVHLNVWD